ncbi:MAG: response regulator transcription factor [Candidatus Lustribacter sp.]|jgi:DNA-binding response OmpR family regulator
MNLKLLVVEDDAALRDVLKRALEEGGHIVDTATDGPSGELMGADDSYDAIVLDVMLPGRDGIAVVRALRDLDVRTPVLMLTARITEADTVAGLDAGADDYLRKPFGIAELQARLRSISRREPRERPATMSCGGVAYDPVSRRATRNGRELDLTHRETIFLEYFLRNAGRALSREMIAAALWPSDSEIGSNVIDVYVRRLRAKLNAPGETPLLQTVRGIGYRLDGP